MNQKIAASVHQLSVELNLLKAKMEIQEESNDRRHSSKMVDKINAIESKTDSLKNI